MVWDNFQRGQELRDQRGGRSSKFLIGTVDLQCYVSSKLLDITDQMHNQREADVICRVAVLYRLWILKQIKSSDKHLRLIAHFMSMSGDFLEFVHASVVKTA
jgi:hypothetical protein